MNIARKTVSVLTVLAMVSSLVLGCATVVNAAAKNPVVVIETSMGDITAELFQDKAPKSVENFLGYVKSGYYSGTIFHRVIKGFMIQCGGITPAMTRKPTTQPAIVNEAANGLLNERGTLAMARTTEVNSATSQFFINTVNNAFLNHRGSTTDAFGYAVFGKVISGMDIVDKIEKSPTGSKSGYENVPLETIVIKAVRIKD